MQKSTYTNVYETLPLSTYFTCKKVYKCIEIRIFLRSNREEDSEMFKDFKEIMDKLIPIRAGEIGKMLIKRGISKRELKRKGYK